REKQSDNLPRVKLQTNKGDVIVELFKADAPDAASGFIKFVDAKGLDGAVLFPTTGEGYTSAVQIGVKPEVLNSLSSENRKPNLRMHFRGTISLTSSPESKLLIALCPVPEWNEKNIVLGRVLDAGEELDQVLENASDRTEPLALRITHASILR